MKLNDTKIRYIINQMNLGKSTRQVRQDIQISHERVRKIYKKYKQTGIFPVLQSVGRPKKQLTETEINLIITSFSKHKVSASWLTKIIKCEFDIKQYCNYL